ncbi:unnamed protein product [Caretta caretta]
MLAVQGWGWRCRWERRYVEKKEPPLRPPPELPPPLKHTIQEKASGRREQPRGVSGSRSFPRRGRRRRPPGSFCVGASK